LSKNNAAVHRSAQGKFVLDFLRRKAGHIFFNNKALHALFRFRPNDGGIRN